MILQIAIEFNENALKSTVIFNIARAEDALVGLVCHTGRVEVVSMTEHQVPVRRINPTHKPIPGAIVLLRSYKS
jgi:hypothetical protein